MSSFALSKKYGLKVFNLIRSEGLFLTGTQWFVLCLYGKQDYKSVAVFFPIQCFQQPY